MWRALDHTADVLLEIEAPSWAGLLEEAARAWGAWISGGQELGQTSFERTVEVQGADAVEVWVHHWRALHRLWAVENALAITAGIERLARENDSAVRVRCIPIETLDLTRCVDVKAVTWHEARVEEREGGVWVGAIVLDL